MNLPGTLVNVVSILLEIYSYVLIAHALMSWIRPDPYHPVVTFLNKVCEPVMEPVRRVIPPIAGMDLSILVVLVGIHFAQRLLQTSFM
jgi:YggT family protein